MKTMNTENDVTKAVNNFVKTIFWSYLIGGLSIFAIVAAITWLISTQ